MVLYCFDRVVIAAQCTATFSRSIVLPRILLLLGREYAEHILLNCQLPQPGDRGSLKTHNTC